MNLKIFDEGYCDSLKRRARKGDLSNFGVDSFEYDKEMEVESTVKIDETAFDAINSCDKDDLFTAAKLLYELFPNLTGLQASYDPFWIHLSLVELYPYLIKVYPGINKYQSDYVLTHYFNTKFTAYNLCGMWWAVKMTVKKAADGSNDYTLTSFLLNKNSQLTQSLVESQLFRCREVTIGVIEHFMENPNDCTSSIIKESLKYLNLLGSIKQLASLPSEYFKEELRRQIPKFKE